MLDDHTAEYGRQTKWKFIIVLILLALAAMAGAWAAEHWTVLRQQLKFRGNETNLDWQEASCDESTKIIALSHGALLIDGGMLRHLGDSGRLTDTLDTGAEQLSPLSGSSAGAWSEEALYRWTEQGFAVTPVPAGILQADVWNGEAAVISKGSGYLTRTLIFGVDGAETAAIGLTDSAMTQIALTEHALGSICAEADGGWSLRIYEKDGTERVNLPLEAGEQCQLRACGSGFAVLAEQSLRFFDEAGTETGAYALEMQHVSHWAADDGWAALLLGSGGVQRIVTVDDRGNVLGEGSHTGVVRDMAAESGRLYILDMQCLSSYNMQCRQVTASPQGARAAGLSACDRRVWLVGNGELCRIITK